MELAHNIVFDIKHESPKSRKNSVTVKNNNQKKKIKTPSGFIDNFETFLLELNYAETTVESNKIRAKKFCSTIQEISGINLSSLTDCKNISREIVIKYEQYLLDQIKRNKLKPNSAYSDLKAIRLFLKFLYFNKVIAYKYSIPKDMIPPTSRSNHYLDTSTIIHLAENIASRKNLVIRYRNLALLLLLVETGCRFVEASSLLVSDVKFTEKTIRLKSVKSGTRTLKISSYVLGILKKYANVRNQLNPNGEYFFLKNNGSKTNTKYLTGILNSENIRAFGKSTVHARALRHTYITNAIDNKNDIVSISATMGHKHWVSTMHYLHRDKNRLLKNTLPYSPIDENLIKGENRNAH
jgi:integrase/recombinase XerC